MSAAATERRRQIVASTIDVVAEQGYPAATFARIAERAHLLSTRLISYHLAGKDELMNAVLSDIYGTIGEFVEAHAEQATTPPDALAAYIRSAVALNKAHRREMTALTNILLDHRSADGGRAYDSNTEDTALSRVQQILRKGQRSKHFRRFHTFVLASAVQRSLDGLPFLLHTRPDLDLDAYDEELVTAFDLATRA